LHTPKCFAAEAYARECGAKGGGGEGSRAGHWLHIISIPAYVTRHSALQPKPMHVSGGHQGWGVCVCGGGGVWGGDW
jgi:hypothetical protein